MSVLGPALVSGGGNLIGGIIDYYGAAAQSHRGRQFAREMSSTQYQRAVTDMKAAGLNPLAVFGGGGGSPAAVPPGDFSARSNFSRVGSDAVEGWSKAQAAVALEAQSKIYQANAKVAESEAEVKLAENSALGQVLKTDAGKLGFVRTRYGSLGAAGEVMGQLGLGNVLGGESSARSSLRSQVDHARRVEHNDPSSTLPKDAANKYRGDLTEAEAYDLFMRRQRAREGGK